MRTAMERVGVGVLTAMLITASGASAQAEGKIAFINRLDDQTKLFVMDADGGNRTEVYSGDFVLSNGFGAGLSWSPDGRRIAARQKVGFSGWDIITIDIDSGDLINLTDGSASNMLPSWSPDGNRIAYVSFQSKTNGIFVMNADGNDSIQLSNGELDMAPVWSPDGGRIAFSSERDGNEEIYVMDADGDNVQRLTDRPGDDSLPSWSPDGSRIAFVSFPEGNNSEPDIYMMDADGGNLVQLTNMPGWESSPSWSPDGTQLVFTRTPKLVNWLSFDIYTMDIDGSNLVNLTEGIAGGAIGAKWVLPNEIASLVQALSWGAVKQLAR